MRLEQAVIFCGGRGERLRPLTDTMPKPMVPVGGKPFLDYLIETLKTAGIREVLLLCGYKADFIKRYYEYRLGIKMSIGKEEDDTGARLVRAFDMLEPNFLLCYGDNYWPALSRELPKMISLCEQNKMLIQTTVFDNSFGSGEYGKENNVRVRDNYVVAYDKTRVSHYLNGVDIGYFIVDKQLLWHYLLTTRNLSFEQDILRPMAGMGWVSAYLTGSQYKWITDLKSLSEFEKLMIGE